MRVIFLLALFLSADMALAQALDTWPVWSQAQPYVSKQVPPAAMVMRGAGTDAYYVLEVDPTTGAIPVTVTGSGTDPSVAPTGDPVPADAAYVGAEDPSGDLQGLRVDASRNLLTKSVGHTYADSVRNAYASTNVTTGAWVELIAATAGAFNGLTLFDSSGQTLELGTGAAASETRLLIIPPGGIDGFVPVAVPAGTRISVRALSATASVGELTITGFN